MFDLSTDPDVREVSGSWTCAALCTVSPESVWMYAGPLQPHCSLRRGGLSTASASPAPPAEPPPPSIRPGHNRVNRAILRVYFLFRMTSLGCPEGSAMHDEVTPI